MASFTDNPAGQQFAEYIPPVNLELYAGILAQRQQDYEEGYKKIQSTRDTVAGLPVYFDYDKKYLNDATTQLNKELNQYATADFSDPNVVGKLTSMASKVYNDPNVRAAVASATSINSALKSAKTARDTGKGYAEENEWELMQKISAQERSGKVGTPFSVNYRTYKDPNKEAMDYLEAMMPNSVARQVAPGKFIMSEYMEDGSIKAIDPAKVDAALESFLQSRNDVRDQLQVSTAFGYRNHTPEQLQSAVSAGMKPIKESMDRQILALEQEAATVTTDSDRLADINDALAQLYTNRDNFNAQVQGLQNKALSNPDSVKNYLGLQNFKNGIINVKAYSETTSKLIVSPIAEFQMKQLEAADKYEESKRKAAHEDEQMKLDWYKAQTDRIKAGLEGGGDGTGGPGGPGGPGGGGAGGPIILPGGESTPEETDLSAELFTRVDGMDANREIDTRNLAGLLPQLSKYVAAQPVRGENGTYTHPFEYVGNTAAEKEASKKAVATEVNRLYHSYLNGDALAEPVQNYFNKYQQDIQLSNEYKKLNNRLDDEWNKMNANDPRFKATEKFRSLNIPSVTLRDSDGKEFIASKKDMYKVQKIINQNLEHNKHVAFGQQTTDELLDNLADPTSSAYWTLDRVWDRKQLAATAAYLRDNRYRGAGGKDLAKRLASLDAMSTDAQLEQSLKDMDDAGFAKARKQFMNSRLTMHMPTRVDPGRLLYTSKAEPASQLAHKLSAILEEKKKSVGELEGPAKKAWDILNEENLGTNYSVTYHAGRPGKESPYLVVVSGKTGDIKEGRIDLTPNEAAHYRFDQMAGRSSGNLRELMNIGTKSQTGGYVLQQADNVILGRVGRRYFVKYDVVNTNGNYSLVLKVTDRDRGGRTFPLHITPPQPFQNPEEITDYVNALTQPDGEALITKGLAQGKTGNQPMPTPGPVNRYLSPTNQYQQQRLSQ